MRSLRLWLQSLREPGFRLPALGAFFASTAIAIAFALAALAFLGIRRLVMRVLPVAGTKTIDPGE